MEKIGDMLIRKKPFQEMVMGNTAVVRAMVEAGTRVVTSYPGSPTPEIATAINSISKEKRPFYFEFSVNEKVATEVAFGAALNGNLSTVFFKSVGLNVALDSFVQLGLMNIPGGLVIIVGDDPGANSSQNEQDNRNIFRMSRIAVLEPASPREVYQYYLKAAKLAKQESIAVVLRLTTHVCHARETVSFGSFSGLISPHRVDFSTENGPYIPIAALALEMKRKSLAKMSRIMAFAGEQGLNTVIPGHKTRNLGVITQGLTCRSLQDVLQGGDAGPDILKLGMIYPMDTNDVVEFLKAHNQVLILEELDDIHEKEIKALAFDHGISVKLLGKNNDENFIGEYTPDKVLKVLKDVWPDFVKHHESSEQDLYSDSPVPVPPRPAQMCPGCGHRSAFHAVKKAVGDNDITVADIGCHTLGFLPPYEMGQVLLCMGASPGIASGLSLFNIQRKVVAFIGDSTFFHAGLPGIMNTLLNHHNITLIVMENGTTAMTGHQDHAGREISIESLLQGLGIKHIFSCDTYQQSTLIGHVKAAMAIEGLSVVIAKHPCMLKLTRAQRKKSGFVPRHVKIDDAMCSRSHDCVELFGCPSFVRHPDGSVGVNHDLCIGDGSCRQVCPEKAISIDS
ncbi:indolepyruvate ferredoxin oxidoreductase alpha subunit [Desulfocicer vacuolatum DSM 3385]|uniref:Indolepyruvate oxidoreductase subunit IorA n=1 Tax=Desulfocicer vacuolatum DSM 3385 TaxID=1121400 RepID=A0A1W2EMQ9_9BACT|nr:thiamine pyrophosphate-dependent enzyme [Desulfocicer vacuolatum]SMD10990.1 indolepyruvate ferredoxin oxidoreductase alpha subunit [Desulfocicer vacuolatum DSM 3385]